MTNAIAVVVGLGLGLALGALSACTAQDRYAELRAAKLRECELEQSEQQRQQCRQRLAPASYEDYQRQRRTRPKP